MKNFLILLYDLARGKRGRWWLTFLIFILFSLVLSLVFKTEVRIFSPYALLTYILALVLTALYILIKPHKP